MSSPIRTAVVPVAGLGTRLLPLTKSIPKEMLPVGRRPCIEHIAHELIDAGIERVILVTSPGKELIESHFRHNELLDQRLKAVGNHELAKRLELDPVQEKLDVQSVIQQQQLGLGHALLQARDAVGGEDFVLALGDSIIHRRGAVGAHPQTLLRRMLAAHARNAAQVSIAFQQVSADRVSRYGIARPEGEVDSTGTFRLAGLVEKPPADSAPSRWAITARYVLSNQVFDELERTQPGHGGEIQLTDALQALLKSGSTAQGVCLEPSEDRIDVGNLPGYFSAFLDLALSDPEYGSQFQAIVENRLAELAAQGT